MENISKLVISDTADEKTLAESQATTNKLARARFAEALDRIDRGESVEGFAFGLSFVGEENCEIAMGGTGEATLGLIDLINGAIVKQTINGGVLIPALPQRLDVLRASGSVDLFELLELVMKAGQLLDEQAERNERKAA